MRRGRGRGKRRRRPPGSLSKSSLSVPDAAHSHSAGEQAALTTSHENMNQEQDRQLSYQAPSGRSLTFLKFPAGHVIPRARLLFTRRERNIHRTQPGLRGFSVEVFSSSHPLQTSQTLSSPPLFVISSPSRLLPSSSTHLGETPLAHDEGIVDRQAVDLVDSALASTTTVTCSSCRQISSTFLISS